MPDDLLDAFEEREPTLHKLRAECKHCRHTEAEIRPKNGQDCLFCANCGKYQYNASRTETGRKVRSVSTTRDGITPKIRARVIERASGHCEFCGRRSELHVDHMLPADVAFKQGFTDSEINHMENLAALCAECNLGKGKTPVSLRFAFGILRARLELAKERAK